MRLTISHLWLPSILELGIGFICGCMPVITILIKDFVEILTRFWDSMKRHFGTIPCTLRKPGESSNNGERLPSSASSGIRTFIRRFHRSYAEESVLPMTDVSASTQLESIDKEYHEQLKAINAISVGHPTCHIDSPSAPFSRGQAIWI